MARDEVRCRRLAAQQRRQHELDRLSGLIAPSEFAREICAYSVSRVGANAARGGALSFARQRVRL